MTPRFLTAMCALALCATLFSPAAEAAPRCFNTPGISDCIDGRIAAFWQQQGGLPVFGYPIGPAQNEQTERGQNMVQHFERARLELHPENQAPYDVLLARMGAEALQRQGRDWASMPKSAASMPHFFAETGQAIAPEFWGYWSSHGLEFDGRRGKSFAESLALFGMPLTPAQPETSPTDGKTYLTQWFERARFELHPEYAGTADAVQLGLLERELTSGASSPSPGAGAPAAAPAPQAGPPGGFIQVQGDKLTRLGQVVQLKGVNYYPQWRPWSEMWWRWDGQQMERELRLARDQLGINAVRILVPYNISGTRDGLGKITPRVFNEIRESAQIAGDLHLRLIVSLFDFYVNFEKPGSPNYERDKAYVRQVVGAFANDERIFAWDIHNEPDHYGAWGDRPEGVQSWLSHIANEVHAAAPNQLVTVGMGQHTNLWAGPQGQQPVDYSDFVSVHIYDAGSAARVLDEVRAHTNKPIVVEEFGWPTDPPCMAPNYTEETQAGLYRDIMAAAKDRASGMFAWTLRDYEGSRTMRWDTREEHFGLYRADDTLKPAATIFRNMLAAPLPSADHPAVALTTTNPALPNDQLSPLPIPGTPYHVKSVFRRAWETLGGQESFGLPLSNAFERPSDHQVVQYFEKAVLEFNKDADDDHDYDNLPEIEKIHRSLIPQPIGRASVGAASQGAAVSDAFRPLYDRIDGGWRLGAAISAERVETVNGTPTRVQYFENGRLEWNAQTQSAVVSSLGGGAWQGFCAQAR